MKPLAAAAVVAAVLVALPLATQDPYWLHVAIIAALQVSLAVSLRVIWNVGLLSCGHAAFMGIGAYASALFTTAAGQSPWLGLVAGALAAAVVSAVLGFVSLRLRGIYFVLVTFAFNEVFVLLINRWRDITGGPSGLVGLPRFDGFTSGRVPYYYLALALLGVTLGAIYWLERSRIGMIWLATRDSELRAECVGINVVYYRVLAFALSAVFAGAWGAYYAHYVTVISPTDFTIWQSIYVQLYMIVGGAGAFLGPILGGAFLTVALEFMRVTGPLVSVVYGLLLTLVMLFLPGGIVSLPEHLRGGRMRARAAAVAPARAVGGSTGESR